MAMTNAKTVTKLLKELRKMLGREPTLVEFRDAMDGRMPTREDIKIGGTD